MFTLFSVIFTLVSVNVTFFCKFYSFSVKLKNFSVKLFSSDDIVSLQLFYHAVSLVDVVIRLDSLIDIVLLKCLTIEWDFNFPFLNGT